MADPTMSRAESLEVPVAAGATTAGGSGGGGGGDGGGDGGSGGGDFTPDTPQGTNRAAGGDGRLEDGSLEDVGLSAVVGHGGMVADERQHAVIRDEVCVRGGGGGNP